MPDELLIADTFDHYYQPSDVLKKWTKLTGGGGIGFSGLSVNNTGRTGYGLGCKANFTPSVTFPVEYREFCCGVAHNAAGHSNEIIIFNNIRVDLLPFSNLRVTLQHVGDGRLIVLMPGGIYSFVQGTVISLDSWYHYGLWVKPTLGTGMEAGFVRFDFKVWINGQLKESTYGLSPTTISDPDVLKWATCSLQCSGGGATSFFDDFYLTNGPFLGDSRWYCIRPEADTVVADWDSSMAGDHYPMVANPGPSDPAKYLAAPNIGDRERLVLENISKSSNIVGAQGVWLFEKNEAGTAMTDLIYQTNATEYLARTVAPGYGGNRYFLDPRIVNPVTGLSWTPTEINALEQAMERSA